MGNGNWGKQLDFKRRKPLAIAKNDREYQALVEKFGPALTQFELALIVTHNAFQQWVVRCGGAAGIKGYSPLELLILHMIGYKDGSKRIADLCFALKIEDTHLVSYALKKLGKAKLVESRKVGKETFFSNTREGSDLVIRYGEMRQRYLVRTLALFAGQDLDLDQSTDMLLVLSGLYEQAARHAENAT